MASWLSQWLKYTKNEPEKMASWLSQWLKYTPIYANGLGTRPWFVGFYFLCPEIMSKWQVGLASGLNTKIGLASGLNIPKHTMNIEWACLGPTSNDSLRFCLFELAWAQSSSRRWAGPVANLACGSWLSQWLKCTQYPSKKSSFESCSETSFFPSRMVSIWWFFDKSGQLPKSTSLD